jgi:hypothetical protein
MNWVKKLTILSVNSDTNPPTKGVKTAFVLLRVFLA